ncbi:hypothetical protein [Shewanella ulleungensis]|uniref:Uncharacterized protein n=1 Tax=Shewanella ulleungensis TaxID=2282699 RepID=A0ABQ2QCH0_9GAMM|nr:hypothetical protein [Shewanella ulleungensis]MCL1149064.1 hypothetical protein [Shewanella ulleungensis]GGP73887.1 hypothetical protein GCM10009410_01890 [Shewanella ulleungensis]
MTTLTKEEVISQLQIALEEQSGKAVLIEQAGSWYKIDGGKSVRFSELEKMHAKHCATHVIATAKPVAQTKPAVKKQPGKKATTTSGGLTPKQLWRLKLENTAGHQTLPRGF